MTEVTYYIDDFDNKIFENLDECREYEIKHIADAIDEQCSVWSKNEETLTISAHKGWDWYNDLFRIKIPNETVLKYFQRLSDWYGWDTSEINSVGTWYYKTTNDWFGEWVFEHNITTYSIWENFEIRDITNIINPNQNARETGRYDLIQWNKAHDLCMSLATIEWDNDEYTFNVTSIGRRLFDYYEFGLNTFICAFMDSEEKYWKEKLDN